MTGELCLKDSFAELFSNEKYMIPHYGRLHVGVRNNFRQSKNHN